MKISSCCQMFIMTYLHSFYPSLLYLVVMCSWSGAAYHPDHTSDYYFNREGIIGIILSSCKKSMREVTSICREVSPASSWDTARLLFLLNWISKTWILLSLHALKQDERNVLFSLEHMVGRVEALCSRWVSFHALMVAAVLSICMWPLLTPV